MTLQEAQEIKTAPRPQYTISATGYSTIYKWTASTGDMLVTFLKNGVHVDSLQSMYFPNDHYEDITMDSNHRVHYYELRFGKADPYENGQVLGYSLTGTGNPTEIFIGVLGAVEDFMAKNKDFCMLEYSAQGRGRVKSYNLLTRIMTDIHGLDFYIHGKAGSQAYYFVFVKDTVHTLPAQLSEPEPEEDDEDDEEKTYLLLGSNSISPIGDGEFVYKEWYELRYRTPHDPAGYEGDWEDELSGMEFSSMGFQQVGAGVPWNSKCEFLYTLQKFNAFNGSGLVVDYKERPDLERTREIAENKWPFVDSETPVNRTKLLRNLYKLLDDANDYLDYIIVTDGDLLDTYLMEVLQNFFNFEKAPNFRDWDEGREFNDIVDEDNEGNRFRIYHRLRYDFSLPVDKGASRWTSLPSQRVHDRQQDLPFGY
jgi:hypothetical protein